MQLVILDQFYLVFNQQGVLIIFNFKFKKLFYRILKDENGQGASEILLLLGGVLIVVLILVYIYKDYISNLGSEISSNELSSLNNSFSNLSSKFD